MKLEGDERKRGVAAIAVVLVAFACSSRHRLGRLEGDDAQAAGGSRNVSGAGASPGTAGSGTGAADNGQGQAGDGLTGGTAGEGAAADGAAGDGATPHPEPGVFVVQ